MTYCNRNCNKLCPRYIISNSVTVVTIDGTDTLVIDIPLGAYNNRENYCIVVAQAIPTTATVTMPVAISIGGDTTTVYPLVCCKTCLQAVACQVNSRRIYKTIVATDTTSGVFKVLSGLGAYCPEVLTSLPITTPTTPAVATADTPVVANQVMAVTPLAVKRTTTTKKESVKDE
jgi:hypothetical protein